MLDSEPNDTMAADGGEDTLAAEGNDTLAAEDDGEVVISIEGEDPEPDEDAEVEAELGDKGKRALKALRDADKAKAARIRELEAKVAEATPAPKEDELGPRPVIADYGFNDDLHAAALLEWGDKKRARDAKVAEEAARQKAATDAYQEKLTRYHAERGKVGVDDDAQSRVVSVLSPQQQSALMDASGDPAKVVAALAKTPKVLAELAGIKEIHKFTYRLAQIEGKITMTTKAPPPPESKLRGGGASVDAISTVPLEKLRMKAQESDDWDAYFKEKRRRTESGAKG